MQVVLIGFMGVGKTTIGKLLSKKLDIEFIDLDTEIEKQSEIKISEMFKLYGEDYFRKEESKTLDKSLKNKDVVIATGGGIVSCCDNINTLKQCKNVIFLDASTKTLVSHLTEEDIQKRPLLKNSENIKETIQQLLDKRYDNYIKASNYIVNIDNKQPETIVNEIIDVL